MISFGHFLLLFCALTLIVDETVGHLEEESFGFGQPRILTVPLNPNVNLETLETNPDSSKANTKISVPTFMVYEARPDPLSELEPEIITNVTESGNVTHTVVNGTAPKSPVLEHVYVESKLSSPDSGVDLPEEKNDIKVSGNLIVTNKTHVDGHKENDLKAEHHLSSEVKPEEESKPESAQLLDSDDISLAQLLSEHDFVVFGPVILEPKNPPKKSIWTEIAGRPCFGCSPSPLLGLFAPPGPSSGVRQTNENSLISSSMPRTNIKFPDSVDQTSETVDLYRRDIMRRRLNSLRSKKMVPELHHGAHQPNIFELNLSSEFYEPEENSRALWSWNWWPSKWWQSAEISTTTTEKPEHEIIILSPKPKQTPTLAPAASDLISITNPEQAVPIKSVPLAPSPSVPPYARALAPIKSARNNNPPPNYYGYEPVKKSIKNIKVLKPIDCSKSPGCPIPKTQGKEIPESPQPIPPKSQFIPITIPQQNLGSAGNIRCPFMQQFRR